MKSMSQPNILFLMCDQLRADVFAPDSPCLTPNLDKLCKRGLRLSRAYTPNPVCSPARASLMTSQLPHNHGVLYVINVCDSDQAQLRKHPHWAEHLQQAGYRTGYFGKWHVERSGDLARYGWQKHVIHGSRQRQQEAVARAEGRPFWDETEFVGCDGAREESGLVYRATEPSGESSHVLYNVADATPDRRGAALDVEMALAFLRDASQSNQPWCCACSLSEPHDPFVPCASTLGLYDVDALPLPTNLHDEMGDKPGVYRRLRRVYQGMSERQRREAMACYYAVVSELDAQLGRLFELLDEAGQADQTLVVLTSDHGEFLGAHGLYCKNIGAFEEAYRIPLILAGPGVVAGATNPARVGLHDLGPTLLELAGAEPLPAPDGRSAAALLKDPVAHEADWQHGYAEYEGGPFRMTQRVCWNGPWKFVFNPFDEDELYRLDEDPHELRNLASDPVYSEQADRMMRWIWAQMAQTGDRHMLASHKYLGFRMACVGASSGAFLGEKDE